MNIAAKITLIAWIPTVFVILLLFRPKLREGVAAASIVAWLFLPFAGFDFEGLPPFDKATALSMSLLLGVVILDTKRLVSFKPHWIDLPMVVWCVSPFLTSVQNGLGPHDGLSEVLGQLLIWGIPYFIARLYFSDVEGFRVLGMAMMIGGVLYVPLCLYEIRMSPQLHRIVYGEAQHSILQAQRFGGYRPSVFMQHGLMVALWMAVATLVSVWMWMKGTRRIWKVPMPVIVLILAATTVLCKSLGAIALFVGGVGVLFILKQFRWSWVLIAAVVVIPVYLSARLALDWDATELVQMAALVSDDRAQSLEFRLYWEEQLKDKAMQRPFLGWGGWNRSRIEGVDSVTDSLWILAVGKRGVVGLVSIFSVFLLPLCVLVCSLRRKGMKLPFAHPVTPLAVISVMFALDCVLNAMINPLLIMATGSVAGASVHALRARKPSSRRHVRRRHRQDHQRGLTGEPHSPASHAYDDHGDDESSPTPLPHGG